MTAQAALLLAEEAYKNANWDNARELLEALRDARDRAAVEK